MKKSRYTEEQISMALRQAEAGTPVAEICRSLQISEHTFYRWKRKSDLPPFLVPLRDSTSPLD